MANVFELEGSLTLNTDQYKQKLSEAGSASESAAKQIGAKEIVIGNIVADLAKKGGEFFVGMAKTGIQYNAQIETYTTALTTALGNEAAAAAAIEQIKRDAAVTPYSVDGLVKANSYLIMAGDSAEQARATINALGDAVAATGGGNAELQRMAQNLQQVKNVGKATSMDIRQFAMAGIDIYGILADYTGKTTAEVQKLTITYDMLSGALQHAAQDGGKYFQAMSRQSQTFNGQVSTLKDNIQQKLGQAFEGLTAAISKNVLPAAIKFVSAFDMSKVQAGLDTVTKGIAAVGATLAAQKVGSAVGSWVVAFQKAAVQLSLYSLNVGAANVAQGVLNGELTASEVVVGVLTGKISLATAAQTAWNTAVKAFPGAMAAAGIAALVIAVDSAQKKGEEARAALAASYETSGQAATRIVELRGEIDTLTSSVGNVNDLTIAQQTQLTFLQDELKVTEGRYNELAAAENAAGMEARKSQEGYQAAEEGLEEYTDTVDETTLALAAVIEEHEKLSESMTKKVKSWFGLFDKAKTSVKTSVKEMMEGMQSQIDFNTGYSRNLNYLAENGLSALGTAFQSMGADGAAYAEALVTAIEEAGGATSAGGQQIIADFQSMSAGVDASQADLSASLTNITGTLESKLAQWGATAQQAANALNVSGAASRAAQASVNAYIAGISAGKSGAYSAAAGVASAASAGFGAGGGGGGGGGIPGHAEGADYIPYDNYLAYLHKGEMVIPADISDDLRKFVSKGKSPSPVKSLSIGGNDGEIISLLKELISVTKRPVVLDSGALVGGIGTKMDNQLGEINGYGRRGLSLA